jgi:polyhydroxyalkanoate synthesis repressor PhaR
MAEKILVKKYSNRRLYDTEKSAYITLNDMGLLIKNGRQIQVIDAKTQEDVTAFILTQIIMEEARKKNILLPAPVLHLIIQYGGALLEEFFENYFQQIIKTYLTYKSSMDEQFRKWIDVGMNLSEMTQKALTKMTPFNPVVNRSEDNPEEKRETPNENGRNQTPR